MKYTFVYFIVPGISSRHNLGVLLLWMETWDFDDEFLAGPVSIVVTKQDPVSPRPSPGLAWSAQTGPDPHHQDVTAQWPLKFDHCDLELGMGHLIWLSCVLLLLTPSALGYVVIDRDYLAALIRDYIAKRLVVWKIVLDTGKWKNSANNFNNTFLGCLLGDMIHLHNRKTFCATFS